MKKNNSFKNYNLREKDKGLSKDPRAIFPYKNKIKEFFEYI